MTLVWLYAVTAGDVPGRSGLEGAAVRGIEEAGLTAVVSDVPSEIYEQPALDEHVRDGEWLTPRATTHQEVNAAVHGTGTAVLPVPFGTIYRSDEPVREMLRTRSDELKAKLEGVRGRAEWVIALYRDTPQAAEHLSKVREAMHQPVAASPGRAYLEARKTDAERRTELRRLDEEAAAAAQHVLERVSKRSFAEPVVDTDADLIARTTYLVRRNDEERLHGAVALFNGDWNDRGYALRATGPWPPYRSSGVTR